jgi:hypothetical protein
MKSNLKLTEAEMNGRKKTQRSFAAGLLIAALAAAPALATTPAARVLAGPTSLQWLVEGGNLEGVVLTVSAPDGAVTRREVGEGQTPTFEIFDAKGNPRPDGVYAYELQLVPKMDERARAVGDGLRASKETGAGGPGRGAVLSGYFRIANGSVVAFGLPETGGRFSTAAAGSGLVSATAPDQTVNDDLIVSASACVGLACADGESFTEETLRLKANVLRLHLEDTSTGSEFPKNDWQIAANDSASGGADRFSIEDLTGAKVPFTLQAGAPDHSLYVASSGNVGLGTSTPGEDVHLVRSDAPTVRLEQDATLGNAARAWDVAADNAGFLVQDVTNGDAVPFRIAPGAPTGSVHVSANGFVGLGTQTPGARLEAYGNGETSVWGTTFDDSVSSQFALRRARGTIAAPLPPNNGDVLGSFSFRGWNGSSFTGSKAFLGAQAEQNWTSTGNGARLIFSTTPIGDTVLATRMTIKGSGNVGIGTTAPSSLLHVNGGDIRVTGGSFIDDGVALSMPDYVFEAEYGLPTLEELREFVEREKHLPNVPSAEEVRRDGLNLSRFQLEKIEELTLYTLQQEDRIGRLEAELQRLRGADPHRPEL